VLRDCRPILVCAYGNEMAADDAFGPLVAAALAAAPPTDMEIVNLGMKPLALLGQLAGRKAVCVVDAARCDDAPAGTLIDIDFSAANRLRLVHDAVLSTHGLSVADELALAERLDIYRGEVRLVAAVVESVELGIAADTRVLRQVPAAACRIAEWASKLSVESQESRVESQETRGQGE
jgi:hydrogenase maturation protease